MHYFRMRRNGRLDVAKPARGTCYHCGAPTKPKRVYCSNLCMARERTGVDLTRRQCAICDTVIPNDWHARSIYCQASCRRTAIKVRRYGISIAQWREMTAESDGCSICGSQVALVIDHEHVTGRVRGLLCGPCNAGIGMLGDEPERLEAAAAYLRAARNH
jgi:hypothetical protein